MAEKRGQYAYLDDGTVAQLVQIAGADSTGGAVNTTTNEIRAMDLQARLVNTAVTHTSSIIAPSGASAQSAWQVVPDGMTEFINNLSIDTSVTGVYTYIAWSEDGTTTSGMNNLTTSNTTSLSAKTSPQWYPVGGAFYKVTIANSDAAPHTCSANIKFRP